MLLEQRQLGQLLDGEQHDVQEHVHGSDVFGNYIYLHCVDDLWLLHVCEHASFHKANDDASPSPYKAECY